MVALPFTSIPPDHLLTPLPLRACLPAVLPAAQGVTIQGRLKSVYSVHCKMVRKSCSISEVRTGAGNRQGRGGAPAVRAQAGYRGGGHLPTSDRGSPHRAPRHLPHLGLRAHLVAGHPGWRADLAARVAVAVLGLHLEHQALTLSHACSRAGESQHD